MIKNKKEIFFLALILILGFFLRFYELGYSHFYGDETKTLYVDKTVPAFKFLLDQRKGPVQFIVAWVSEKISGGFNELYIRIPFALAGFLSIIAFYLLCRKLFGYKASLISTFLFTINGFYIAFSRTAQYQSFLILFGLLSIYFFIVAMESKKSIWYLLSSLCITLSLFSHYDAIFFLIPTAYMFFIQDKKDYKRLLLLYMLPAVVLLSIFYLPYISLGYLVTNTVNYVGRRLSGSEYVSNYSLYTFFVYNPIFINYIFIGLSFFYILFFRDKDKIRELFLYWFLIAFIFFNGIISNPGTHIHNYFIPLYLISGSSILFILSLLKNRFLKYFSSLILIFLFLIPTVISIIIYIPKFNQGYPWKESKLSFLTLKPANKGSYHLYIYGFPYNRGWDQILSYFDSIGGVRGFYTNDNSVMSKYYLMKYDLTPPGSNFLPQYYIDVVDNMDFVITDEKFLNNYDKQTDIFVEGNLTASVYKLRIYP